MKNELHDQVRQAEVAITGERYCYACAKFRPAAGFKYRLIFGKKKWKCGVCSSRANPSGLRR